MGEWGAGTIWLPAGRIRCIKASRVRLLSNDSSDSGSSRTYRPVRRSFRRAPRGTLLRGCGSAPASRAFWTSRSLAVSSTPDTDRVSSDRALIAASDSCVERATWRRRSPTILVSQMNTGTVMTATMVSCELRAALRYTSAARLVPCSLKIPAAIKSAITEPTVARASPVRLVIGSGQPAPFVQRLDDTETAERSQAGRRCRRSLRTRGASDTRRRYHRLMLSLRGSPTRN
jgi:hypothetical protein